MTRNWGYVSAVASAASFGISSVLNKIALQNVHPTVVAGMIYFIGGVFLLGLRVTPLGGRILSLLETSGTEREISARDFRILAFAIVCGSIARAFIILERSESENSNQCVSAS